MTATLVVERVTLWALDEVADPVRGRLVHVLEHRVEGQEGRARALVERYAESDREHYADTVERAGTLTRDPVQQLLVAVGLLLDSLPEGDLSDGGCLYASFCYQNGLWMTARWK